MSGIIQGFLASIEGKEPPPTEIGQAYGGGFYAGNIVQGGTTYYIIVAPKSSGENSSKKYKTSNTDAPTATRTLNDGPTASASINSADYPAAEFCEALTIGGFSDWYMPARDELELCYRNLKSVTNNNTNTRDKSSFTYPEGNDVSGDKMGVNRNSSPTGAAYGSSFSPSITSALAFQSGGIEAFATEEYSSSTDFDTSNIWLQNFINGAQSPWRKDTSRYVRAVRRVAV